MTYDASLTVLEGRNLYFTRNGFSAGGNYESRWVRVTLGPIPFYFPNIEARRSVVRLHDLHHVLTEYPTTTMGEAEIGAWEVGSGCGRYAVAWVLNLAAFGLGLFMNPRKTFRAFVRGRKSGNLYVGRLRTAPVGQGYDSLLTMKVGELRDQLKLAKPDEATPSASDRLAFAGGSIAALFTLAAFAAGFALPPAIVVYAMIGS